MAGLCRWLDVSNTTIVKWQKAGMPHIVIDGVTLYDKHQVRKWRHLCHSSQQCDDL